MLGQAVKAEEPLFAVHDLSAAAGAGRSCPSGTLPGSGVGQPARVRLVADPASCWTGGVARSGRVVSAADRTRSRVWVELDASPAVPLLHEPDGAA